MMENNNRFKKKFLGQRKINQKRNEKNQNKKGKGAIHLTLKMIVIVTVIVEVVAEAVMIPHLPAATVIAVKAVVNIKK